MSPTDGPEGRKKGISRRELFKLAGAAGTGLAVGAGGMGALATGGLALERDGETYPFYGAHQSGIATPSQARLHFAAFDVVTKEREDVRGLLRDWSEAAAKVCAGEPVGDVGEAIGRAASRLKITFGPGPSLFGRDGEERFGLATNRPAPLAEIPSLPGDALEPSLSG